MRFMDGQDAPWSPLGVTWDTRWKMPSRAFTYRSLSYWLKFIPGGNHSPLTSKLHLCASRHASSAKESPSSRREERETSVQGGALSGCWDCLQVQKKSHGPTGDATASYSQAPWVIHLQSAELLHKWIIGWYSILFSSPWSVTFQKALFKPPPWFHGPTPLSQGIQPQE